MCDSYRYGTVLLLDRNQNEAYWVDCCEKIKSLKMNTVVIWPPVFYEDGQCCLNRQRTFMEIADKFNLKVIVELTGQVANLEYFPDCLYDDAYAVRNSDSSVAPMQNGLGELNYNHPFVQDKIKEFIGIVVGGLKQCNALCAWDIWNETHFKSYDAWTLDLFRQWLENKYFDIAKLNDIWAKSYTSFKQIRLDPVTWASIAPDCDWEEFRTDNLASIAMQWAQWVKQVDPDHPVVADNVMSNVVWSEFDRGTDDWKVAKTVDQYGISFYPKTGGRLLAENTPWIRSMTFAGAASAGGGQFIISEMQSHYYSEIFTTERVSPDDILTWNLEALEQGCVGSLYWKWAPFTQGFQVGGRGLTLADGSLSKRADAAGKFGELLANHPQLGALKPVSKVGCLYDRQSNFLVKAINNRVEKLIGDDQPCKARMGLYRMCWERNLPICFMTPGNMQQMLHDMTILFLPYQVSLDDRSCECIKDFVSRGGILVANYPFVDINQDGQLYKNLPGGPLNDLLGATQLDNLIIEKGSSTTEIQELKLDSGAEILWSAHDMPLIYRRPYQLGHVIYAASSVWLDAHHGQEEYADKILDLLVREHPNIVPAKSNVHTALTRGGDADYLFIGNDDNRPDVNIQLQEKYQSAEVVFGDSQITFHANQITAAMQGRMIIKLQRNHDAS